VANLLTEGFDLSNGTTLSNSTTAFTDTTSGAGTSVADTSVFKTGTASGRFTTTANNRILSWDKGSSLTNFYASLYIYPRATPSTNTSLLIVGALAGSANATFLLVFNATPTARSFKIQDNTQGIIQTVTNDGAPLNEWSRVDVKCVGTTVTLEAYFGNANCDSPVGTALSANTRSGATGTTNCQHAGIGVNINATNDFNLDYVVFDDAATPGPVPPPPATGGTFVFNHQPVFG
jgi:hypothetical protein